MEIRRIGTSKKTGEPKWQIEYTDAERIRRRRNVVGTKQKAKLELHEKKQRVLREIEERNNPSLISLDVAVERYMSVRSHDSVTEGTIQRDRLVLNHLMNILSPNIFIGSIEPSHIEDYKSKRSESKTRKGNLLTPAGLSAELRHLRAFFNWLVNQRIIRNSPMVGVKFPKVVTRPIRFLHSEELLEIRNCLSKVDKTSRDLFNTYIYTGARKTEILRANLTWDEVDFSNNIIRLKTKGQKYREIPMQKELRSILLSRKKNGEVFPFDLSKDEAYRRIIDIYTLAKIKDANVHTLRKTTGALLIQKGVDIFKVSKFLGHSSVVVTEKHYVDLIPKNYRDMADLLEQGMREIENSDKTVTKKSEKGGK